MARRANVQDLKSNIFKWDSKSKILTKESITPEERLALIDRVYRLPGEMNLDERISRANKEARDFQNNGYFCDRVPGSRDYKIYWDTQKALIYGGLLIDDEYYITGDTYWYLNFAEITFKGGITMQPEIRDTDIWFFQLIEKAELQKEFTVTAKVRQFGFSLKLLSKLLKRFWFEHKFKGKFSASDDEYLTSGWQVLEGYRDFLNANTGWHRNLDPSGKGYWQQRLQMPDKSYLGNFSTLKTVNTKNKASQIVSGATSEAFIDEAGISKNLGEVLGLLTPALMDGNIVTGCVHVGGAAGNVSESQQLKSIIYNPEAYNMLALPNVWGNKPHQKVGIFVPAYYSYGSCKDEFGNSLIEEAKIALEEQAQKEKLKSFADYQIFKAQYPQTLEDMFKTRLENIFPTELIEPHYEWLTQNYEPNAVTLHRNEIKVFHKLGSKYPVVKDFPVKRRTITHGAVCVVEPPLSNPPFGLYYAGVDTVTPIKTTSSVSLQSIHIYKASHEIDGEYDQDKLVAWYTGRCEDPYETYQITLDLIEWYNARACIENNNRNFIQWMIGRKKTGYMMKKNQMPLIKDMVVRASTDTSDYGITTTTEFKKDLFNILVEYCREIIGYEFKEDGTEVPIFGVTRIKDEMVLREMLDFNPHPKFNCDRLISYGLSIFASKSNTNRGIIVKSKIREDNKKVVNYREELAKSSLLNRGFHNVKLGF
jgi:hypothetical protein